MNNFEILCVWNGWVVFPTIRGSSLSYICEPSKTYCFNSFKDLVKFLEQNAVQLQYVKDKK